GDVRRSAAGPDARESLASLRHSPVAPLSVSRQAGEGRFAPFPGSGRAVRRRMRATEESSRPPPHGPADVEPADHAGGLPRVPLEKPDRIKPVDGTSSSNKC